MTAQAILQQLVGSDISFQEQANLEILRSEHHPQSYTCDEAGKITGLVIRELKDLPQLTFTHDFHALQYLNISENPSLKQLHFVTLLSDLFHLDLSDNQLSELQLPPEFKKLNHLDLSRNQLTQVVFQGNHPLLHLLDLSKNQLQSVRLPAGASLLQHLYLNDNQLTAFRPKQPLKHLNTLGLKNNQFTKMPLDFLVALPSLQNFYLYGNQLSSVLQGDIEESEYKNDLPIVHGYIESMQHNPQQDNECKVLLLGNGDVGKTTFAIRLIKDEFQKDRNSTHGITLDAYMHEGFQLNIWDFGGQDIYHATHRLFMQDNSIYLIFWDIETEKCLKDKRKEGDRVEEYNNHPLSYWLHYASMLGKRSPVIIVQTKTELEGHQVTLPNVEHQKFNSKFPYFKPTNIKASIDDWKDNGVNELLALIKLAISHTKRDELIPEGHFRLRAAIRQKQAAGVKSLSMEDYDQLVQQVNQKLPPESPIKAPMNVLKNWLGKTGVILFKPGYFQNRIILNQAEIIEAVYTLFEPDTKFYDDIRYKNKGYFTGRDLQKAWQEKYPNQEEHSHLLSLMLTCELCFETTPEQEDHHLSEFEHRTFVAPQFLKAEKPKNLQKIERLLNIQYHIRYQYPMLHYGLIQSFIVHSFVLPDEPLAEETDIWKYGIYLSDDKQDAFVEADLKENSITLKLSNAEKPFIDALQNLLEKLQDGEGEVQYSINGEDFVTWETIQNTPEGNQMLPVANKIGCYVDKAPFLIFKNRDKNQQLGSETPKEGKMSFDKHSSLPKGYLNQHKMEVMGQQNPLRLLEYLKHKFPSEELDELDIAQWEILANHPAPEKKIEAQQKAADSIQQLAKKAPDKKRFLFVCSSPKQQNPLNFGKELKVIENARRSAENKDQYAEIEIATGVEFASLFGILRRKKHRPQFLHFAMHASKRNGLYFEDKNGGIDTVSCEDFVQTIARHTKRYPVEYLILSACNTLPLAEAVLPYVKCVVATREVVADDAAILYAQQLYETIFDEEADELDADIFEDAHEQAIQIVKRQAQKEIEDEIPEQQRKYTSPSQKFPTHEVFVLKKNDNKYTVTEVF